MSIPATLFKEALPVSSGVLPRKIRGKYDTRITIELGDKTGFNSASVTTYLQKKLPAHYVVTQSAKGAFVYCDLENSNMDTDFDFRSLISVDSVHVSHITKEQAEEVSEFGKILRDEPWFKKYHYRAIIVDSSRSNNERTKNALGVISNVVRDDQTFITKFIKSTFIPLDKIISGETPLDSPDADDYYLKFFKVESDEFMISRQSATKMYIYATSPGIGMMAALVRGSDQSCILEEAIIPNS